MQMLTTHRKLCVLAKYSQPLFRDGAVYFSPLRFCTMTSPGLFHLSVDGFQADVSLCLCVCPPVLSFWRKRRKGCSESYTPAFPTTSQVHLKTRSDDTRAPGAPLSLSLAPASSLSFSVPPSRTFTATVACFEGRNLLRQTEENVCQMVAVVFPCRVFLFGYWSRKNVTTIAH